jgi:hypothetical protein
MSSRSQSGMPWFRFYGGEVLGDPKLAMLSDAQFRVWVNLLCLASTQNERGMIVGYGDKLLAALVAHGDQQLVRETLRELEDLRIVAVDGEGDEWLIGFIHFESRQRPLQDGRPQPAQWKELRAAVFARDDYTCQYCGARGVSLHCDHVIPVSRGGPNDLDNLVTACKRCNQAKYNRTPEEWLS